MGQDGSCINVQLKSARLYWSARNQCWRGKLTDHRKWPDATWMRRGWVLVAVFRTPPEAGEQRVAVVPILISDLLDDGAPTVD